MTELIFESPMPCSVEELWEFHSSSEALKSLTPPMMKIAVSAQDLTVREGAELDVSTSFLGVKTLWTARLHDVCKPEGFSDTAVRSPFKAWTHRHAFLRSTTGTVLRDTVHFEHQIRVLEPLVSIFIRLLFAYRHRITAQKVIEGQTPAVRSRL